MIKTQFEKYISGNSFFKMLPLVFLLASCTTTAPLPHAKDEKALPQYWLTTSLYFGPFYDDDKLKLIDFRPFFALDDAKTLDGLTVAAKNVEGTIPAGSLVTILDIAYPDSQTKQKRPLFSPRDNIWVSLRIGKERGRVTVFREKPHILVIPLSISTEEQLHGYLKRFLSNKDPNRWLLQQESYFQKGIFEKSPVVGMKRQHLISALGPAIKKQYQKPTDFAQAQEIWHYHDYLIVIENDMVNKISKLQKDQRR
jgi:hypothetical protein